MEESVFVISRAIAIYVSMSLVFCSPFVVLMAQVSLAIREIAINTRKQEYPADDYKLLYWIATILNFVGVCMFIGGIILLVKSC